MYSAVIPLSVCVRSALIRILCCGVTCLYLDTNKIVLCDSKHPFNHVLLLRAYVHLCQANQVVGRQSKRHRVSSRS